MKIRQDASNSYEDRVEITAAEEMLKKLKADGMKGIGILHLFIAAYVRCVSQFPALNRFCSGQRIYARNEIEIAMVVKKKLAAESGETSLKLVFAPDSTLQEIYEKLTVEIDKIKDEKPGNEAEDASASLMKLPHLLLKFVMWMLRLLDYFGKMPQSIISASPFHSSLVISDLGSVGIGKIYHHLYDFGNLPVFIAFGKKYRVWELNKEGQPIERRYVDYGCVTDERICDGYYYALSFRHLNHYLHNPELLLVKPEKVVEDIE
jgi:hypothetical protein